MNTGFAAQSLRLVVDANVLVGYALTENGRMLVRDSRLHLLIAEYTYAEFQRHVARRVQTWAQAKHLSIERTRYIHASSVAVGEQNTTRIPLPWYQRYEGEARRRIPHDPDDWHTAALALAYDAAIWTEDKHFWGCGIAVWSTARLLSHLTAS